MYGFGLTPSMYNSLETNYAEKNNTEFLSFFKFPLIFVSKLLRRPSCKYANFLKESVNNMHVHVFYFISNCGNDILDLIKMKFKMFEMKLESS